MSAEIPSPGSVTEFAGKKDMDPMKVLGIFSKELAAHRLALAEQEGISPEDLHQFRIPKVEESADADEEEVAA